VGVEVQPSRNPANSITTPAGMYHGATPMTPKGTCSPVPGGRLDQSRSCFARDRDPSFTRAPMSNRFMAPVGDCGSAKYLLLSPKSTGAPNKGRGRSAYPASELMVKGR